MCPCVCVFAQARKVVVNTIEFNAEFVARMLVKLDWTILKTTAESVRGLIINIAHK